MSTETWRIDDLAHKAGLTVDTVRYYQSQGLLPAAERCGRAKVYGPQHLERLERIRELQQRRFSLAAIRALLTESGASLLEGVFADRDEARGYALDELVERSGIDHDFATALHEAGLLRDPAEHGRAAYDGEDLDLVRATAELRRMGVPDEAIVELGRIYAAGIEATQRQVVELFAGGGELDWSGDSLAAFQALVGKHSVEMLPVMRRLVDYAHHRTMQRLALAAIERGALPAPPS